MNVDNVAKEMAFSLEINITRGGYLKLKKNSLVKVARTHTDRHDV